MDGRNASLTGCWLALLRQTERRVSVCMCVFYTTFSTQQVSITLFIDNKYEQYHQIISSYSY